MSNSAAWRLIVCRGCAGEGRALAQALADLRPGVEIAETACLSVCAAPVSMAAQGAGRATYVFSGLGPRDLPDIAAFADAYEAAPRGWIADARPLGRLRFQLVSRVPALPLRLAPAPS